MEFKKVFLLGFIVLCCISVATTQTTVTLTTPQGKVTGRLSVLVEIFKKLGIRLPPTLRAMVDKSINNSEPITSPVKQVPSPEEPLSQ